MGLFDVFRRPAVVAAPEAIVAAPNEPGVLLQLPRPQRSVEAWAYRAERVLGDQGVGFVKWFNSQLAVMVGRVIPVVEHQMPNGDWTKDGVNDPLANALLQRLRGPVGQSFRSVVESAAWHRQSLGQFMLARHSPETYSAHSVTQSAYQEGRPASWRFMLGTQEYQTISADRVWRCWKPDKKLPYEATSATRDALTDLELCLLFERFMKRGAESGLTMRSILWVAKEALGGKMPTAQPGGPQYQLEQDYAIMAGRAWDQEGLGAVAPWLLATSDAYTKPQPIEMPFTMRPEILQAKDHCLKSAARSLNAPQALIVGEGDSNHWNEWQMDEKQWEQGPQPIADAIFHDDFTTYILRPVLIHLARTGDYKFDPERVRIGYDASRILTSPDKSEMALELGDRGLIRGTAIVRACGFDIADMTTEEERLKIIAQYQLLRSQPRGPIDSHSATSSGSRLKGQPPRQGSLALMPFGDEEAGWLD